MNIVFFRPFKIGDALVTFPVLVALREKYTNPYITYMGDPAVVPLAKAWGIADEVYNYDAHWEKLWSKGGIRQPNLRNLLSHTDIAILWVTDYDSLLSKNLLKAGAKEVLGTSPILPATATSAEIDSMHAVEHLARSVGVQLPKPEAIVLPNISPSKFCPSNPPRASPREQCTSSTMAEQIVC